MARWRAGGGIDATRRGLPRARAAGTWRAFRPPRRDPSASAGRSSSRPPVSAPARCSRTAASAACSSRATVTLHYLVDDAVLGPGRPTESQAAVRDRAARRRRRASPSPWPLSGAAVWGPDPALAQAPTSVAPGARLPAWLTEILARKVGGNPSRDTLISERNGEPGYRWAALHTAGDDYLLDFDPRRAVRSESLARLRRVDGDVKIYGGRLSWEELVTQPVDSRPGGIARALDVASIATEIELTNDRADHATITVANPRPGPARRHPSAAVLPDAGLHRPVTTASAVSSSSRCGRRRPGSLRAERREPARRAAQRACRQPDRRCSRFAPRATSSTVRRATATGSCAPSPGIPKPGDGGAEHSTFRAAGGGSRSRSYRSPPARS